MVLSALNTPSRGMIRRRPVRGSRAPLRFTLTLLALTIGSLHAATITFDEMAAGYCLPVPQCVPAADTVLTNQLAGLGVVFGQPGQSMGVAVIDGREVDLGPSSLANSIVGLDTAGNIPDRFTGSIFFGFFQPGSGTPTVTDSVSFELGDGGGDADSFEIRAYALDDTMLTSFIRPGDPSETERFPVEILVDGMHRIEIERLPLGTGTQFGYSLDDLSFNLASNDVGMHAPEPSTWLMLVSGLAGCLALKRYTRRG